VPDPLGAKPLRIVHYLPAVRLADGGVARAVLDVCAVLAGRGHAVSLLCHQPADIPGEWLESSSTGLPRVVVLPQRSKSRLLRASPAEMQVLARTDVLHLHAPWEVQNLRFASAARRLRVPYVLSVHGMLDDWSMSQRTLKKRIYLALAGRRLLDRAAIVHCTADAELAQARKWFSNPRTAVLPILVDLQAFESLPGPESGMQLIPESMRQRRKILFLGRLHEKKGADLLIRASQLLRDRGVEAVTLIGGTGDAAYENHLKSLVVELNLTDRVAFLGMVTGPAKISLLQAVDLLALPTQQENFGLALAEAMACGTPVVTTRGTDIWKEIESAGAIIADRTPQAFASAISGLLANEPDRLQRGQSGRAWAFSDLATQPLSRKYEAMYQGCMAGKN